MEINDKKRHEVAENLRKQLKYMRENDSYEKDLDVVCCGNLTYRNIAGSVELYGNFDKGNYVHIVELLADLIDHPTCHDIGDGYAFKCSKCECELDIDDKEREPTMWVGGSPRMPNYCPNCGAEVIK